jgi:hypothetical protein
MMTRQAFLTLSSAVAVAVAAFALGAPHELLASKGVEPVPALVVWVREVGALILAAGVTTFLVRKAPDSAALRGVLVGNGILHFCLLPIEIVAFAQGVVTNLGGVAPNSVLHVLLGAGFVTYARGIPVTAR